MLHLNTTLICYWSEPTDSPVPNSHHWCWASIAVVGWSAQTNRNVLKVYTFQWNQHTHSLLTDDSAYKLGNHFCIVMYCTLSSTSKLVSVRNTQLWFQKLLKNRAWIHMTYLNSVKKCWVCSKVQVNGTLRIGQNLLFLHSVLWLSFRNYPHSMSYETNHHYTF